jgi:arginine utilization protein RocB
MPMMLIERVYILYTFNTLPVLVEEVTLEILHEG